MARIELPAGTVFERQLPERRDAGCQHAHQTQRPPQNIAKRYRQHQPCQEQQHQGAAQHEQSAHADDGPGGQDLLFQVLVALLLQLALAAAELIEPLIKLHALAQLRDQLARLCQRVRQTVGMLTVDRRGDLPMLRGCRFLGGGDLVFGVG